MKILGIPKGKLYLSLSGGIDSMVLANFLMMGKKDFSVIHFDHKTPYGAKAREFVEEFCLDNKIDYKIHPYSGNSCTEFSWAGWRRSILVGYKPNIVLTAHHKDDSLESFLMRKSPILYQFMNIYRPLLATTKKEIIEYGKAHGIQYMEDPTNSDPESGLRNKIRNELIPMMRECKINPYRFLENRPC